MRRALIVGINDYPKSPLHGCENDAAAIAALLARHENGDPNFECRTLLSSQGAINQGTLRSQVTELFSHPAQSALLYFSGHGAHTTVDGFLVTQDYASNNWGVSMAEVLRLAGAATGPKLIQEVFIIIDCCHSGWLGTDSLLRNTDVIPEGVSILTACSKEQVALERGGHGLFTACVCDALFGGAADVLGNVTAASIYSYLHQTFGAWDQRPLFKANLSKLETIRICSAAVAKPTLRNITALFPQEDSRFQLSPEYEPTSANYVLEKGNQFTILQKYRAARLVIPDGEEHLYWAAMHSKSCSLTPLGRFYWKMVTAGKL